MKKYLAVEESPPFMAGFFNKSETSAILIQTHKIFLYVGQGFSLALLHQRCLSAFGTGRAKPLPYKGFDIGLRNLGQIKYEVRLDKI
ncbi:MAG: hypothetical protein AB1410_05185 [Acidobacteriota bacterium]